MGKKYAKPPLVEVVCEFRLSSDTPWDLTVPGLLYEKVKGEFPHREQRLTQEVEIKHEPKGAQYQVRTSERILLFAEGRRLFIQLGPRLVAVNCLSPYPTWAGLRPKIEKAWTSLVDTVEVKGLERIGLRYINQITMASSVIRLEDYFQFYPYLGTALPQQMISFIISSEFAYHDGRDRCRVQLTTAEAPQASTFFLDIDYFLAQPKGVAVGDVLAWVDEAHDQIEAIFEGCITDRLRELFGEVK